ncbi:MAG: PEP-CTERM sorting domain-containing protein [Burkholderiales bacterium]|nr:PEP-CTERM sorting domain-containing protein [Burkholderiales bacterium]
MELRKIAAAVCLATAGVAHASLDDMNTGNSSVAFIAIDDVGATVGSAFIDLGFNMNDFDPTLGSNLSTDGNKVMWDFSANTITVNGVTKAATNDFSAFASFVAGTDDAPKWGVIAGDSTSGFKRMLTTGTPTPSMQIQQSGSNTASMALVNTMWQNSGVSGAVDNGSYYASNAGDLSYVAKPSNFGVNWQYRLKWAALTANAQNNFWMAVSDGTEQLVGPSVPTNRDASGFLNGKSTFTFNKAASTLTWETPNLMLDPPLAPPAPPALPEPESFALALVGLVAAGFVARRRSAQ